MSGIAKILKEMRSNPKGIRFPDLKKVCDTTLALPATWHKPLYLQNTLAG